MDAPDELRQAVRQAVASLFNAEQQMLDGAWFAAADAVLAVPAIADALQALDAVRYRLRAEVRWLETQPASEWATTRQVAMLDVIRLLDGGPWVDREHVVDGERCWCDPQVETVPAKKSATEAADTDIRGCNCASYNNPEKVRPTVSGPVSEVVLTPPPELGIERETVCVDACIATVVQHLWSRGIVTLGSCCGHGRGHPDLVLGQHEDFEIVRACIAEVIPTGRWVGDEYGWDLSQWQLVTNSDFTPADAKLMAKLERDAARPARAAGTP